MAVPADLLPSARPDRGSGPGPDATGRADTGEPPLICEPGTTGAVPLTSEPPLPTEAALTSEPPIAAASAGEAGATPGLEV